jgi:PBP1b-binding outer membrane lipoprotein LpoB
MKKIIPLIALLFLAGCGNNSTNTVNQSAPANPATGEQPANPGTSETTNSNPATETATNSPATNSGVANTNGSVSVN